MFRFGKCSWEFDTENNLQEKLKKKGGGVVGAQDVSFLECH